MGQSGRGVGGDWQRGRCPILGCVAFGGARVEGHGVTRALSGPQRGRELMEARARTHGPGHC